MKNISKIWIVITTVLFVCITSFLYAQNAAIVKGKVTDKETGNPLEAASVYFSKTTIGAMVKKNGQFTIEVTKPGNYELVVSMIGYEIQKKNVLIQGGNNYNYEFKLVPKVTEIAAVEVLAEDQEEWKNTMAVFKRRLLGELAFPEGCTIKNLEYVNFKKELNTLIAICTKPLIITSEYLGYEITAEISRFYYNPGTYLVEYSFIPWYKELNPIDENQKEEWEKNREKTYLGSPEHFLWALKNDTLYSEGFVVTRSAVPDLNKRFVYALKDEVRYQKELKNPDHPEADSIIYFPKYLKIWYKRNQVSLVKLTIPYFTLDEYGRPDTHLPFECLGYWAKYGLASRLPIDYLPESLKKIKRK